MSGNTFVCDEEDVYCVWNCSECDEEGIVDISLDFFKRNGDGSYRRSGEEFSERAYSVPFLTKTCEDAGLEVLAVLSDMSEADAKSIDDRIIFVTRKR